jgi:F-type H+-transporting ATPase subunit b
MLFASNSNFLIPNWTFVAELIIFLIVLGVMALVVLPPLNKALADRSGGIRDEIQRAEAARAAAEEATRERRAALAAAREQARGIVDGANRSAETARQDARARGQEEYARLLEQASAEVEYERRQARAELSDDIGTLVVAAAERVIGSEVNPKRHAPVIATAVAAARATGGEA